MAGALKKFLMTLAGLLVAGAAAAAGILITQAKQNNCKHTFAENYSYVMEYNNNDYYGHECTKCGKFEEKIKVEEDYELQTLINNAVDGTNIHIERNILKSSADESKVYIVTKPINLIGKGFRPVIEGSIRIELADDIIEPFTMTNLEIEHNGQYNNGVKGLDERRGVLVKNGSVEITKCYIHLEENVADLYAAPTGIQISVSGTNPIKNQLTYKIENNIIGVYNKSQTTASSAPCGILLVTDPSPAWNEVLNMTEGNALYIFNSNIFEEGSDYLFAYYDYEAAAYKVGVFGSREIAADIDCAEGKQIIEENGIFILK